MLIRMEDNTFFVFEMLPASSIRERKLALFIFLI